jgi:hypothetical protein
VTRSALRVDRPVCQNPFWSSQCLRLLQRASCTPILDGAYDCVDRIVLRAYFRFIQQPGGFRLWWRQWQGSEEHLDDAHLMRVAGHFARRLKAWAVQAGVPVIFSGASQRKEFISAAHLPTDPDFTGLFLVVVGRAPASVWHVAHTADGRIRRIERKRPWVNHYAFHIRDPDLGHVIIRFCPDPPFNALVILNGHEWVAAAAARSGVAFRKEDNCFTDVSNAAGLEQIAETLSSTSSAGRLLQVCERWIYSAVLCFAVETADQERTDIRYSYSIYQGEYSRTLLFRRGAEMDQVFQRLIDRVRGSLQLQTVRTLFGRRQRPRRRKGAAHEPTVDIVLERPAYDLTVDPKARRIPDRITDPAHRRRGGALSRARHLILNSSARAYKRLWSIAGVAQLAER